MQNLCDFITIRSPFEVMVIGQRADLHPHPDSGVTQLQDEFSVMLRLMQAQHDSSLVQRLRDCADRWAFDDHHAALLGDLQLTMRVAQECVHGGLIALVMNETNYTHRILNLTSFATFLSDELGTMSLSPEGSEFLFKEEAQKGVSNHLHWPKGASGVTLGPGYDMKGRSAAEIEGTMKAIGLDDKVAKTISGAAGLTGEKAQKFAKDNHKVVDLTDDQEKSLFTKVTPPYEKAVNESVTVALTQSQFDALVSLCYNIGIGRTGTKKLSASGFKGSGVLTAVNALNLSAVPKKFRQWNTSGGEVNAVLKARREREIKLFFKGMEHLLPS